MREDFTLFEDDFAGAQSYPTSQQPGCRWQAKLTKTAGSPTCAVVTPGTDGEVALTCDSTSELQCLSLYWGDKLCFDISKVRIVEWIVSLSGTLSAVQTFAAGISGAENDTLTSMVGALFTVIGDATSNKLEPRTKSSTVTCDTQSGLVLSTSLMRLQIDLTNKKNVKFYAGGQRVLPATVFDLSSMTGGVQPMLQIAKASGTGVPAVTASYVRIGGYRGGSGVRGDGF